MKESLKNLLQTVKDTGSLVQEKTSAMGQAAVDSTISPSLEVEMRGKHVDFPPDRIAAILAEHKSSSLTGMIFSAVKTTYRLHSKIAPVKEDPLIVKIRLSLSPEISVSVGAPKFT
jgi:hypothetical protein